MLGPVSTAFLGTLMESWIACTKATIWDACALGSGLTHCATAEVPRKCLLMTLVSRLHSLDVTEM